jgi:hypothetical protein
MRKYALVNAVNHSPIVRGVVHGCTGEYVGVRLRHRQHKRLARHEDPVNLSKEPFEVGQCVDREDYLARRRGHVVQGGKIGLEAHTGPGPRPPSLGDGSRRCDRHRCSMAIDSAPARANVTELNHGEMLSSMARRPSAVAHLAAVSDFVVARCAGPVMDASDHDPVCLLGVVSPVIGAITSSKHEPMVSAATSFTISALRGTDESRGLVDHQLVRRMLISQVTKGRVPLDQVCDAHPELIRALLKLVTYVFCPRLSSKGTLRVVGQGNAPA